MNTNNLNRKPHTARRKVLVSKQESAELLSVSVRTLEKFIKSGQLPHRKLGRRTLIPYAALVAFARR